MPPHLSSSCVSSTAFKMRLQVLGALLVILAGTHAIKPPLHIAIDVLPSAVDSDGDVEEFSSGRSGVAGGASRVFTTPPVYHQLPVGDLGTVRGIMLRSFLGRDFYSFMSLPYAQPPVDDLRFKVSAEPSSKSLQQVDIYLIVGKYSIYTLGQNM